jgi:alpha-glucosidase
MYRAENSVLRSWLKPPYRIDGWRLDVANMTARQDAAQLGDEVWREVRESLKADKPDTYIMGENYFDGSHQLQGDQLDGTMNYSGLNIPLWRWLSGYQGVWQFSDQYDAPLPSETLAEQTTLFRAAIPWVIATQQFNQLCSHDSVRILNIVKGDKARMKLGLSLLMTYPGVPCVYYGDEIGLAGGGDPDNRRPMIWDESRWDSDLLTHYRTMIDLRKTLPALINGGYQQLVAQGDVFAFTRHTPAQRLVMIALRSDTASTPYCLPVAHGGLADGVTLIDLLTQHAYTVQNGTIDLGAMPANAFYLLEVR